VAIAITLVATHQENDLSIERHGSTYIAILGKVLVFFMVFRSKLTYDRYTDARKSVQVMFNQLKQMAQSTSIYIDGEAEADKADRAELYRLQVRPFQWFPRCRRLSPTPLPPPRPSFS
jgi:predicted membrane chloride channel (bestrophin family)